MRDGVRGMIERERKTGSELGRNEEREDMVKDKKERGKESVKREIKKSEE